MPGIISAGGELSVARERRKDAWHPVRNQYDTISHPRFLEITGQADPAASVSVTMDGGSTVPVNRALPEHQTGDPGGFRYAGSLTSAGARMAHVRIEAMKDDASHVQEGWLYAPPATKQDASHSVRILACIATFPGHFPRHEPVPNP